MADCVTIDFHAEARARYFRAWADGRLQDGDLSLREVAANLLEHSVMLWHCTGDRRFIEELARDERRCRLVVLTSEWISGMTLADDARALMALDVLDDDQIGQVEMILLRRHALQDVLTGSRILGDSSDPVQRRAVTDAICKAAELDAMLLDRPDIVSVASRIMEPVRDDIIVGLNAKEYWWLFWAREIDEMFDNETLPESMIAAILRSTKGFNCSILPTRLPAGA